MNRLQNNKGFALVFSLIFLFLVVSFMAVYMLAVAHGVAEAVNTSNSQKAYYIAEAGLADTYNRIVQSGLTIIPSSTCANYNIPSTCTVPYIPSATTDTGAFALGAGSPGGSYKVDIQYSGNPRTTYIITSQGTYDKTSMTLQMKIIASSFSRYAYWSQTETNPQLGTLWWISGMLTTGPVQTNGQFNIIGNPVFNGAAAEVSASPNYKNGTGSDPTSTTKSDPAYIFPDGLSSSSPAINLPPTSTLADFQTVANGGGLTLTGTSTVIFNSTGTVTVTGNIVNSSCKTTSAYHNSTIPIPSSGVIYVQSSKTIPACNSNSSDGNVTVQGTLSGQLTVAADQNVYVSGDVQYNNNPTTNSASTDVLGLVAYNNITVTEASAPAQLAIQAVLVALGGSFNVDQYSKNPDPVGNGLDGAVMSQFGSLVNYASGCTGVVNNNGQLVDGWNQIQSYDNRLAALAPPGFPPLVNSAGQGVYAKLYLKECFSGTCG